MLSWSWTSINTVICCIYLVFSILLWIHLPLFCVLLFRPEYGYPFIKETCSFVLDKYKLCWLIKTFVAVTVYFYIYLHVSGGFFYLIPSMFWRNLNPCYDDDGDDNNNNKFPVFFFGEVIFDNLLILILRHCINLCNSSTIHILGRS
jgi:hypothetical protein